MKATHKGTCQVCGNVQKLPNGRLSKHGYTTRCGFFEGVCWGAEVLPFEQDKILIEGAIAAAEGKAGDMRAFQATLRAPVQTGVTKAWVNVYYPAKRHIPGGYFWKELEITRNVRQYDLGNGKIGESVTYCYEAPEGALDNGQQNRRIARYTYPAPATMESAIFEANGERAKALDKDLSEIAAYIKWQQDRIKGWKVTPLIPVK